MTMAKIEIDIPENLVQYMVSDDWESVNIRNAMILYPYIKKGVISHGKAAELLGICKLELIGLYSDMGIDYLDMTEEEFEEEMETVQNLQRINL